MKSWNVLGASGDFLPGGRNEQYKEQSATDFFTPLTTMEWGRNAGATVTFLRAKKLKEVLPQNPDVMELPLELVMYYLWLINALNIETTFCCV